MYRGILAIVTVIIAIIAWISALISPVFFEEKKKNSILTKISAIIILISLPSFVLIRSFSNIALSMWSRNVEPGAVSSSESSTLGGLHILFLFMFIVLIITLWTKLFTRFSQANWLSFLGSVIFLICINISIYYTLPRYGDEGTIAFLFVAIAFFFADLILIATILIFSISSIIRQINENHKTSMITENSSN